MNYILAIDKQMNKGESGISGMCTVLYMANGQTHHSRCCLKVAQKYCPKFDILGPMAKIKNNVVREEKTQGDLNSTPYTKTYPCPNPITLGSCAP